MFLELLLDKDMPRASIIKDFKEMTKDITEHLDMPLG